MAWTKDKALRFVLDYLKGKLYTNIKIVNRNKFGHAFITTDQENFYWLFKKDFFHSFTYEFPDYVLKPNTFRGAGESINLEYMKFAMDNNATLLFCYEHLPRAIYSPSRAKLLKALESIYPNANLSYSPPIALLKLYCDYYGLKRTQDRENTYKVNDFMNGTVLVKEQTYSFPVYLIERFVVRTKNVSAHKNI